ncbi:MAG TPA: NUDIX domain-containing protein [Candidatus Paceibacterota bacterium]
MKDQIKVKAMCLLENDGKYLVANAETLKGDPTRRRIVHGKFYRALGGSLNFYETAEEGVRREIREELNSEIENLELLDVVENLFVYAGEQGHEVVFLFKGNLADKSLHGKQSVHILEDGYEFDAVWIPREKLVGKDKPLYPTADYSKYL